MNGSGASGWHCEGVNYAKASQTGTFATSKVTRFAEPVPPPPNVIYSVLVTKLCFGTPGPEALLHNKYKRGLRLVPNLALQRVKKNCNERHTPSSARKLIETNIKRDAKITSFSGQDYFQVIEKTDPLGQKGGIVYDALVVECARKSKSKEILTSNTKDFIHLLSDDSIRSYPAANQVWIISNLLSSHLSQLRNLQFRLMRMTDAAPSG